MCFLINIDVLKMTRDNGVASADYDHLNMFITRYNITFEILPYVVPITISFPTETTAFLSSLSILSRPI